MDRSLHPWLQLRRSRLQVRRFTDTDTTCELIKYVHPVAFMSPQRSDDIQAETRGHHRRFYRYMGSRIRKIIACREDGPLRRFEELFWKKLEAPRVRLVWARISRRSRSWCRYLGLEFLSPMARINRYSIMRRFDRITMGLKKSDKRLYKYIILSGRPWNLISFQHGNGQSIMGRVGSPRPEGWQRVFEVGKVTPPFPHTIIAITSSSTTSRTFTFPDKCYPSCTLSRRNGLFSSADDGKRGGSVEVGTRNRVFTSDLDMEQTFQNVLSGPVLCMRDPN